jgi:hypothetical protein
VVVVERLGVVYVLLPENKAVPPLEVANQSMTAPDEAAAERSTEPVPQFALAVVEVTVGWVLQVNVRVDVELQPKLP